MKNKKVFLKQLLSIVMAIVMTVGVTPISSLVGLDLSVFSVDTKAISTTNITVNEGEYVYLKATDTAGLTVKGYSWTSNDRERVQIYSGAGNSSCQIYAVKATDNYPVIVQCIYYYYYRNPYNGYTTVRSGMQDYYVTVKSVKPVSVSLDRSSLTLIEGKSTYLYATVNPTGASQSCTWKTSNDQIVSVSQNGYITACGIGTATITATASNGVKATCKVTVTPYVKITGVNFVEEAMTIPKGYSTYNLFEVNPENASGFTYSMSTSDSNIATVTKAYDGNGQQRQAVGIITHNEGTCQITVTVKGLNGETFSDTCTVEVKYIPMTDFNISELSTSVEVGKTIYIYPISIPTYTSNWGIEYFSGYSDVATVDNVGKNIKVKGVKNGIAVIVAYSKSLDKAIAVRVTVGTGVSSNPTDGDFEYKINSDGKTATLVKYNGLDKDVIVPKNLGGYTLTIIGENAFSNRMDIERITLPEGVVSINKNAFSMCLRLKTVVLPKTVTTISEKAFNSCNKLDNVYYSGNQSNKNNIAVAKSNDILNTATWNYNSLGPELLTIKVVAAPSVISYIYKNNVSTDGLIINAVYSDKIEFDVTEKVNVTNFDTTKNGDRTATVEYEDKTATFDYSVNYLWWQWIIVILLFGWIWY